jgi:hypothetical protein
LSIKMVNCEDSTENMLLRHAETLVRCERRGKAI